jgi:hypothetical protein
MIGLLCLSANTSEVCAAEEMVKIIQNGIIKDDLSIKIRAGNNIFNNRIIKFLDRGFTIRIEYSIELWQSRGIWFDRLDKQQNIHYQLDFEPLEQKYICQRTFQNSQITTKMDKKIDRIIDWVINPDLAIKVSPIMQLDNNSSYYYNISVLVATLTAENLKDLQKWMGEFESQEESSLSKTAFKVIMDFISSRNHKQYSIKSEKFRVAELPKLPK